MKKIVSVCLCFVVISLPVTSAFADSGNYKIQKEIGYQICKNADTGYVVGYIKKNSENATLAFEKYAKKYSGPRRVLGGVLLTVFCLAAINAGNESGTAGSDYKADKAYYYSWGLVFGAGGIFALVFPSPRGKELKKIREIGDSKEREDASYNALIKFEVGKPMTFTQHLVGGVFTVLLIDVLVAIL